VSITDADGRVLRDRKDPAAAFRRVRRKLFWDDLDALYFGGYALWNYLNLPFLLTRPGFALTEVEPWNENGHKWRRLHAVFPDLVPSHCREQTLYFDSKGLVVRHDYTAEVFGQWARAAHYSSNFGEFGGILVPTTRRVFPRQASGKPLRLVTLVSIDIDHVEMIR